MPTPWAQVAESPRYRALPPDQQEAARSQYFERVVAPQVPADKLDAVRAQFDQQTGSKQWQPTKRSPADLRAMAKPQDPTEGMGFFQKFSAGMGKSLVDTGQGVAQVFGGSDALDSRFGGGVDERRAQDESLMDTGAGLAGNIAGQVGQIAVIPGGQFAAAGRAAPYLAAAVKGAAFSGAQGVGEGESRLGNAVVGGAAGAAGQGLATGAGRLASAAKSRANPVIQRSIEAARAAGIPLHVSQVSNSRAVKTMGSVLNQLPFTGAGRAAQKQQEAFNRAVARSFGSDATTLSDDAMKAAGDDLGAQYQAIFNGKTVGLDKQATSDLFQLWRDAGSKLESSQAEVARKQILRILDEGGQQGSMPGQVYQSLRSELRKSFGNGDRLGSIVMDARKILDDSAKRTLGPDAARALDKVNGQYANFRTTQDALKQVSGAAGNVRPASLYPMVRKGSTKEMRLLAQIGQNVLKDPIPDSGTAGRLLMAGGGLTVGGTAGAAGLAALAKPLALAATAGRAMNSNALSKLAEPGKAINGLARLSKGAPQGLPLLANQMGGGTRLAHIFAAATENPAQGPEIIANLSPQEQGPAIEQFAKQAGMDPAEVARRVQAESARLQAQR